MHIPDGYLSPATCVSCYGAALPFWYLALRRVEKTLQHRLVPLISLFAGFSFLVMMFNLPLPGGTTGHAIGIGMAAVVIGPYASILAISLALIIQAIFFADGGITAIGANCFNMAIVGSIVAYGVYRLLAGRSPLVSSRRAIAAGLGGYLGANAAALCAAIEFGIQPLLYRDAAGTPLYCPYPLSITIPAMMAGHLTIAGIAEFLFSAGIVAFLQRTNPEMLARASGMPQTENVSAAVPGSARPLWICLALLLLLTPLGVLAAGTAWGEWMASDFSNPAARQQISAATANYPVPAQAPEGLQKLSRVWTAPFARYAPPFFRQGAFGYLLSAMFGTGVVILAVQLIGKGVAVFRGGLRGGA